MSRRLAVPVVPAITYMLLKPWRFARLLAFLDPWKYQTTYGFQPVQSMIAIGSGGPGGVGFAQGRQKLFYLPAPHTDFIFAVIGEELGLRFSLLVVFLFVTIVVCGIMIAPNGAGFWYFPAAASRSILTRSRSARTNSIVSCSFAPHAINPSLNCSSVIFPTN